MKSQPSIAHAWFWKRKVSPIPNSLISARAADYPSRSSAGPKGWVNTINVTWAYPLDIEINAFLNGTFDIADFPESAVPSLYQSPTPPYDPPTNYPKPGVDVVHPIAELQVDMFGFQFNISNATPFGPIGPPGVFKETWVPSDFFGNAIWGLHVRRAFAQVFDYNTFLNTVYPQGAGHPATAIIPGLGQYDPTVAGWSYNLTAANQEFNAVPGLSATGFTMTLVYPTGDFARQTACNLLQTNIQILNPKFHVIVAAVPWATYLGALATEELPTFILGTTSDSTEGHDFAYSFYHTSGGFASEEGYSNATMDASIDSGLWGHDFQMQAVADAPSFTLDQPITRHFEQDWVVGWYYDMLYPGDYFYNLWKWYYTPQYQHPRQVPYSDEQPADVNYDGKIDMKDIGTVAKAFGTHYGPPIDAGWNFRADINKDRKIDMKDIGLVARQYGNTSPVWYDP